MKKDEVKVGSTYAVKVSGSVVPVLIAQEKWTGDKHTGWIGRNTKSGRAVRIKSASKLRHEINPAGHSEQSDPELPPTPPAAPEALPMPGERADAVAGVAGPDGGGREGGGRSKNAKGKGAGTKTAGPKAVKPPKPKKLSGLDAAAAVLKKAGKPMNFKDITDAALALGWKTNGKTPQATLYAACIREIAAKKKESRFRKTERGMFEHTGVEGE